MPESIKDPYTIYLAFALGWSPHIEHNAAALLAARFGQSHQRTGTMWTRVDLMAKIKEHNRNPVRPAWIAAHDKPLSEVDPHSRLSPMGD